MGVDLLKHNQEAFQEINKMIESGIKKIAAPRATGSGKTYLMGALAEQYNDDKKLVLEPTRPLLNSIKDKFDEFGITNTDFITYQKLIRMSDEDIAAMDYKLIFLDECHHGTAPIWGEKIDCLMETHSDSIIFGTSATTIRNDGVNVVETLFDNNAIGELPLSTAIARKVLPCPHYITAIYRLDDEFEKLKKRIESATNTKSEKKEFYKKIKTMKLHFEKSYGVPLILNKYIKVRNGKYLVFCKNKKHLDSMRDVVVDWFHTSGIKAVHSYAVYSDYPDKETDYKDFCEDNSDTLKLLFSINMLNEGLHIKDISGVLMLRTTQSNLIYLQQLGRLVEAENLDKYLVVFDFVNNFSSVNDGIGLLKEIKEAIAKEKESDPDFDDSGFEDIDTYFVVDQVIEIQEMFKAIEGRLIGSWDVMFQEYCKFYEENGHGDVPKTEEHRKLNLWCKHQRVYLNDRTLSRDRKTLLDANGFVWNARKYRFEKNIEALRDYYELYGKYPSTIDDDLEVRKIGYFITNEKKLMCSEKYPVWKKKIIEKYLSHISDISEIKFNEFLHYAELYKMKYGHIDIKSKDVIDGYNIGRSMRTIRKKFIDEKLSEEKVKCLNVLGLCLDNKSEMLNQMLFEKSMELARRAVGNGIIINNENQLFQAKNLYDWVKRTVKRRYKKGKLTNEEIEIIEKLIGKPLYKLNNGNFVKVVDMTEKREIAICKSQSMATDILQKILCEKVSKSIVDNRLKGKVTTPYKGRFMFYYATDEEVKKYLEDSKAS